MKLWYKKGVWAKKSANKKIKNLSFNDITSIAVIRHAALGDMILTRNFIIEARRLFPNAKITISVLSNYTRGVPEDLVDRIHILHGTDTRGISMFQRIKNIKELGYHDFIFDLACGSRSYYTCFFTPAILKFGFPYRSFRNWLYDVVICRSDLTLEVSNMLNMLELLGAKTQYPHIYDMPGEPVKRDKPYLVYFTGAAVSEKCWSQQNYAELIEAMVKEYPEFDHLILDGLKDWEKAEKILARIDNTDNIYPVNADSIEKTVSLLKGASLLVSNDTGIRHVAITCQTPTVGIFLTECYRYWPRYNIHEAVFPQELNTVATVDEVKEACTTLLERLK